MNKIFNSKLVIIIFIVCIAGGLWYISTRIKPHSTFTQNPAQKSSSSSASIVASSSATPLGLVTTSSKDVQGVFRKIEDGKLFMSNAYEEQSFTLAPGASVTLLVRQRVVDPQATPQQPKISTVALADLKEYDQITVTLQTQGDEYRVTQIYATREI